MGSPLASAGLLYFWFGQARALEFATGYVIEKALSVDNLFVFVVLFGAFQVPLRSQHRLLFWGVLGALLMRALFIGAGSALLLRFHWLIYLFGAFLLLTALKLWREKSSTETASPFESKIYRALVRVLPTSPEPDGERFFTRKTGRLLATPLFVVLVLVELTDVIFAVDSLPAVFSVTRDPFIVFTSNVFAILELTLAVLRARRFRRALSLPQAGARVGARLRWRQNARSRRRRRAGHAVARRHLRDARWCGRAVGAP